MVADAERHALQHKAGRRLRNHTEADGKSPGGRKLWQISKVKKKEQDHVIQNQKRSKAKTVLKIPKVKIAKTFGCKCMMAKGKKRENTFNGKQMFSMISP